MKLVQVIIGNNDKEMIEVNEMLYKGGISWRSSDVGISYKIGNALRYINSFNDNSITSSSFSLCGNYKEIVKSIISDSKCANKQFQYIDAKAFLANPTIIKGWVSPKTHRIVIDGQSIELSHKSFLSIKEALK